MVTDTEIFGDGIIPTNVCPVTALRELYNAGMALWNHALKDQFVLKEFAPFYAALILARKCLELENAHPGQ